MVSGQLAQPKSVYNWFNIIQDYVLPPTCILCGNRGFGAFDLCECCYRNLPRNTRHCRQCARCLEVGAVEDALCGSCLSNKPAFDKTVAPFIYQEGVSLLVMGLKFGSQFKNARLLGLLLADALKQSGELPDCIMPVPLHKARYRERGFNQSIEIARTVARELNTPMELNTCIRERKTEHQTRLSAKKRRKNVKNAFRVVKPVVYQHVAIVDDVMTTGSTVHNIAAMLKKAGVKRVDVWVCARA